MAKLQRWRGGGPAGEGTSPDAAEVTTPEEADPTDGGSGDPTEPEGAEDEGGDGGPTRADGEDADTDPHETEDGDRDDRTTDARAETSARSTWRDATALCLLRAAHPKQGVAMALVVFAVAVMIGRPAREAGIVLATVLTGQAILGWHNDLVDRPRDRAHEAAGKPIATGQLSVANTWFALALAALLLVPLSITTGITAGLIYLTSVGLGVLGNVLFRTTPLSWWSWAASFALLPAYLTYGGWGGQAVGAPPETAITVLAALAGIGVHLLRSVWGLVDDHQDGWNTLPLKLGLKLGATRLLLLSSAYLVVVVVTMAIVAAQVGFSR